MSIRAICLLRIPAGAELGPRARVEPLQDAVLVHTPLDFSLPPARLFSELRALLGELLGRHTDPRGLFVIPHVAAPRARDYAGVIDEVGEGGVWLSTPRSPLTAALEGGSVQALIGQLPPSLLAAASAQLEGDPNALRAAAAQASELLQDPSQLQAGVPGLGELLAGSGIDLSSLDLQTLLGELQSELARDPARLAQLAEQLFAAGDSDEDDEDA